MLAVAVELLTGRYGASVYNDRMAAEWPPHPARLFSAMVATWADADEPDADERAVLRWIEELSPPELACSAAHEVLRRSSVTCYVPVNDPTVLRRSPDSKAAALSQAREAARLAGVGAKAQAAVHKAEAAYRDAVRKAVDAGPVESASTAAAALEVLPQNRNRQPRWFPTVTPDGHLVWFLWPDAEPSEQQRRTLDGLLARVGRLGHSATLVSCRLDCGPPEPTLVPTTGGGDPMRVPRQGLLDRLERDFARHQGTRERLIPAAMARYASPTDEPLEPPVGNLGGDWIVLDIGSVSVDGQRIAPPRSNRALELARAVRAQLLANSTAEADGVIGGRWADGSAKPHLAVVPLPASGYRWADGALRGAALVLPRDLPGDEQLIVEHAVQRWAAGGEASVELPSSSGRLVVAFRPPRWARAAPDPTAGGVWADVPYALRRDTWCRPATRWVSVTPVALDRRIRGLGQARPQPRDKATAAVADSLRRSCHHVGLPEPIEVEYSFDGMMTAVPRAGGRGFPTFIAAGSGERRPGVHVLLTFAEPVAGPVLLGAGRYLGYGLFVPLRDEEPRQ